MNKQPGWEPSLRRWGWGLLGIGAIALSSCTNTSPLSDDPDRPLKVVTTSTILQDWADTVAGDSLEVVGILQPGVDPHVYEPVPADLQKLEQADLVFYNGHNLEPGLIRMIQASVPEDQAFAVGEVIPPLDLEKAGETVPDPHVWGDVGNARVMVTAMRDRLIELSPDHRQVFTTNAADYQQILATLDEWVRDQMQTLPPQRRYLVTTHDAFQYYGRAYGLTIAGTLIGISTEEQPSARTVGTLAQRIREVAVPTIFAETTINPALIQTVAQEAGVEVATQPLYSDSLGAPGSQADTYVDMQVINTQTIVEGLGGSLSPFQK
nr:zinc ABC transporter substrate-binding protein [Petrachloros mirabilis]